MWPTFPKIDPPKFTHGQTVLSPWSLNPHRIIGVRLQLTPAEDENGENYFREEEGRAEWQYLLAKLRKDNYIQEWGWEGEAVVAKTLADFPEKLPPPDPALDFATDAMHGPKDAADPLEDLPVELAEEVQRERLQIEADRRSSSEAAMSDLRFCEGCSQPEWNPHLEGCPVAAAPMSPEEQEKALAHLDAAFEADRQKVISEVMGMVQEPRPQ